MSTRMSEHLGRLALFQAPNQSTRQRRVTTDCENRSHSNRYVEGLGEGRRQALSAKVV